MDDLFKIIRIYGNKGKFPKADENTRDFMQYFIRQYYGSDDVNLEENDGFFPNGLSPENLITRINTDYKIKLELLDRIFLQKRDTKNYILEQQILDNKISWKKENWVKTIKIIIEYEK